MSSLVYVSLAARSEYSDERKYKIKAENSEDTSAESLKDKAASFEIKKGKASASEHNLEYDKYKNNKKNKYEIEIDESRSLNEDDSSSKEHSSKFIIAAFILKYANIWFLQKLEKKN